MGNYTSTVTFETEFDGDNVVCELKRLTRDAMLTLSPYFSGAEEGKKVKLSFKDNMELMNVVEKLAPDFVVSISGMVDSKNVAVPREDIFSQAYFMKFQAEIIGELMEISSFKVKEAKESGKAPAEK